MLQQIGSFLTTEECDGLVSALTASLPTFQTYNTPDFISIQEYLQAQRNSGIFIDPPFTSYSWGTFGRGSRTQLFLDRTNSAVTSVISKLAAQTGLPAAHQSRPLIFNYNSGDQYISRKDFFACLSTNKTQELSEVQDTSYFEWKKNFIQQGGQRLKTLIVFLNDGYSGGDIEFSKIPLTITPEKGKAILFDVVQPGVTDLNGDLVADEDMEYSDNVVTSGSKYTLHIWIREGVPAV